MTVFVKYDTRPPHLPVAVADTKEELAMMLGVSINSVRSSFSHGHKTFMAVEIEDGGR